MLPIYLLRSIEKELWEPRIHVYNQDVLSQWLRPDLVFNLVLGALWISEIGYKVRMFQWDEELLDCVFQCRGSRRIRGRMYGKGWRRPCSYV